MEELLEDVIDFIIPRLNKDNCVEAWLNAVELQHERYERVTLDMLARSFAHVHLDPCLGDAVPGKIQDLLKHPALNVASEQQVFDFVR